MPTIMPCNSTLTSLYYSRDHLETKLQILQRAKQQTSVAHLCGVAEREREREKVRPLQGLILETKHRHTRTYRAMSTLEVMLWYRTAQGSCSHHVVDWVPYWLFWKEWSCTDWQRSVITACEPYKFAAKQAIYPFNEDDKQALHTQVCNLVDGEFTRTQIASLQCCIALSSQLPCGYGHHWGFSMDIWIECD